MDLRHEQTEAAVGRYSADLVFREEDKGRYVVVENMFGPTDHDHLGKLITYAAGLKACYAVLLAPDFRDEHRSALNWLNDISTDDFGFFGVVLEAWRIGDSLPAPRLRVDVQPDEWSRSVRTERNASLTKNQQAYRRFWGEFLPVFKTKYSDWTRAATPSKENWMSFPSARSNLCRYSAAFSRPDGRYRLRPRRTSTLETRRLRRKRSMIYGIGSSRLSRRWGRNFSGTPSTIVEHPEFRCISRTISKLPTRIAGPKPELGSSKRWEKCGRLSTLSSKSYKGCKL